MVKILFGVENMEREKSTRVWGKFYTNVFVKEPSLCTKENLIGEQTS